MKSKFSYIYISALSLFLYGCAQVVAPTGGERDLLPPVVIGTVPLNGSTSFNSDEITIVFDEYIQLSNITEELTVSPPLKNRPNIQVKGKSIVIGLEDTLQENTTYSFNFGNAIKDNHEGTILVGYQYAFSTGEQIDTLKVSGLALDAYTIEPVEKMLVMLYANPTDSTPYLELPRYVTKTNKLGEFTINNIKEGEYLIFGLDDKNRNLKFDQTNEIIAFKKELISVDSVIKGVKLFTFLEDKNPQYLKKSTIKNGAAQLVLNQPVETIEINPLDIKLEPKQIVKHIYSNKDTVDYYFITSDSLSFSAEIIADNKIIDTLEIAVNSVLESDSLLQLKKSFPSGSHKISQPITVTFAAPLKSFDSKKITFLKDSVPIKFSMEFVDEKKKTIRFSVVLEEAKSYQMHALPGAFTDIFSRTIDTINTSFKTTEFKEYGNLSVTINNTTPKENERMMVQLTNSSKQIVATSIIKNKETIEFKHLNGGSYKLKVVFDSNGNNQWDTGDFIKGILPEKVALYEGEITIRSNWDKKIDWNITP